LTGLALAAEGRGEAERAREFHARAAEVNRTFRPGWAQLSFFARVGDVDAFWRAAPAVFEMSHRDREALLALCWRVQPSGRRLLAVAGRRPPVLFDVTRFLLRQDLAAARLAYAGLLEQPYLPLAAANAGAVATREERRALGLDLCDLDLDRGDRAEAWRTWKAMARRGMVDPQVGRGFAWRLPKGEAARGVDAYLDGGEWRVSLDGGQVANSTVFWRYLPPDSSPELPALPTGLVWILEGGRQQLRYERKLGTAPFRGTLRVPAGGMP
jgi:hypothetical protein